MCDRAIRVFVLAIVCLATRLVVPAAAADLPSLLDQLATGSFAEKGAAVDGIASSGEEQAAAILDALLHRRLVRLHDGGRVVIATEKGSVLVFTDPLTGAEVGEGKSGDADVIIINNRLRSTIRGALGSLNLVSKNPDRRRQAADAVFDTRDADDIPRLEKAIARETNAGVKDRLERALAAIRAANASIAPDVRIHAIARLAHEADDDVGSLLVGLAARDANPAVREAAQAASKRVQDRLALWGAVGNLLQGVSLGSVLLLAAVGLAITFGVMGVINMAHGEVMMLGAYTTFVIQQWIRTQAPGLFDYSLAFAVPAAFLVSGLVGIILERCVIRFLYGRPLETLLATWGVSLILQQAVRTIFGPSNRQVGNPSWMSGAFDVVGGLTLTYNRIWIVVFSLVVFALLMTLIARSRFGLQMRAVTQNRAMAASMGIRTGAVDALTFGLGSGIAGIAGVALSQIDNVSPNLGQGYIIDSFMVVVFGGVGNLWGTLVGAFSLGIVNKVLEPYAGAVLGKIIVLVAIILFIQKRPRGLFALKGRAVEN